jgi:soluble lytic murein transglycosylase
VAAILALTVLGVFLAESRSRPGRYRKTIERLCRPVGVDPDLVEAVIDAESSSRSGAISGKGAVGLMQLMPATAREVGSWIGIGEVDERMLRDPELNLRLGIEYLAWLLRTYGSPELALAAYNAGPGRVDRWRREHPGLPPDRLLEEAAFDETRGYVARVLRAYRGR